MSLLLTTIACGAAGVTAARVASSEYEPFAEWLAATSSWPSAEPADLQALFITWRATSVALAVEMPVILIVVSTFNLNTQDILGYYGAG